MMVNKTNAPPARNKWDNQDWNIIKKRVKQLQMRIAKATCKGNHRKASSLQWLLTHSYSAKLLAVKRVTGNTGAKTAGVDRILWRSPTEKLNAVKHLKRRGYSPLPLRRIYIPKKNGKLRPLSIPTMHDRAMQALHLLALEPISESTADKNSYGFRPKRSCADAIEQCFIALARKTSAQWVLEGDIRACFDKINHQWLMDNIPTDRFVLEKWLKAGYVSQQQVSASLEGVPQGGIISPTLLVMTLRGMEQAVKAATKPQDKVNIIVYADDFIITANSKEILEDAVKSAVVQFLAKRGLELSKEKTLITHVNQGFDFLGFNVRKYDDKLLIKPAKENIKLFLKNIREIIKSKVSVKPDELIGILNPKILGWANYYRHAVSKDIFNLVDHKITHNLLEWARRRHKNKSSYWRKDKYFCQIKGDNWVFNAGLRPWQGRFKVMTLIKANSIAIKRHVKIRADANPYNPKYQKYFENRKTSTNMNYIIA